MSRQTNHIGLSEAARALLPGLLALPDGRRRYSGMFEGEQYPLHRYVLPDSTLAAKVAAAEAILVDARREMEEAAAHAPTVYAEFVQDEPWSSGPCIFLALRDGAGQVVPGSLWPQEDIDNA